MTHFQFIIAVLAVWRVTHLVQAEDGPFDLVYNIRKVAGNSFIGKLMDCFYCLSIWVALLPGIYFGRGWVQIILLWLAFSGGAILLERATNKDMHSSSH